MGRDNLVRMRWEGNVVPLRRRRGPSERAEPPLVPDEPVRRALQLLETQLTERWTVNALARRVGLSRPVFARRFRQVTGQSPMRYLTERRLERAAELLGERALGLAEVARQVGYGSEFAFNRAFKRHHHVAPGRFRKGLRQATRPVFRAAA